MGHPPTPKGRGASPGDYSVSGNGTHDEVVMFHRDGVGKVLAVLPSIPENAPFRVREGIARRRIVVITGECPCGARFDQGADSEGEGGVAVVHERLCPAATDRLVNEIRRWLR